MHIQIGLQYDKIDTSLIFRRREHTPVVVFEEEITQILSMKKRVENQVNGWVWCGGSSSFSHETAELIPTELHQVTPASHMLKVCPADDTYLE